MRRKKRNNGNKENKVLQTKEETKSADKYIIETDIPKSLIEKFSKNAEKSLKEKARLYIIDIIREAETKSDFFKAPGATSEITESNIIDAATDYKRGRKKTVKHYLLKAIGEITLFVSGIMFLPDMFVIKDQNQNATLNYYYFIIWLLITLIAVAFTLYDYIKGDE